MQTSIHASGFVAFEGVERQFKIVIICMHMDWRRATPRPQYKIMMNIIGWGIRAQKFRASS